MNKISKKIVALATMAAFVLTLVPAAAFAAPEPNTGNASAQASDIEVTAYGSALTEDSSVDINDEVNIKFIIRDNGNPSQTTDKPLGVRVWAVDSKGNVTDAMSAPTDGVTPMSNSGITGMTNSYYADVNNGDVYTVSFNRDDTYKLIVTASKLDDGSDVATAEDFEKLTVIGESTIVVDPAPQNASVLKFWGNGHELETNTDNDSIVTLDFTSTTPDYQGAFAINGVDTYTLEGYAYVDADKDIRATNATFNLEASRGDDVIELLSDTVTTDANGYFTIKFKMHDEENANIYVSNDDVNYTVRVIAENNGPKDIDTVKDGGYVLAGTDSLYATNGADFSDAVQFEVTDEDGEVLTGDAINGEPAASDASHLRYVNVSEKPAKADVDGDDFKLIPNGDTYTLEYDGLASEFLPGEYTVEVALLSGMNATATFTVAEYGTTQDLVLDMHAVDYNFLTSTPYDNPKTVTDEVMLGQLVYVDGKYVDENGIKIIATGVEYGFDGDAVLDTWLFNGEHDSAFLTYQDSPSNDSLLGTVIKVKAFSKDHKQLVEEELTVVDSYNTYSLEFDSDNGPANKENKVTVSTVDENGKVGQVRGTMSAYIADQSNEDANIDIEIENDPVAVSNGTGTLTIYSDKETTVDIVVAVKAGTAIYAGTLEYTVGAEDPYKDKSVVMTIGSTDYVVNNEIVVGDAAPYVDSNWRTMVPIRALAEAFDAEVDYDNDARTVTINYDETEIVMNINEETYTINGEEQTMDTAPVIGDGDRTYVPIRFTAEAMGYTVTPLYDAETGLTASVVFQK